MSEQREQNTQLEQLYRELFDTVLSSINGKIEKERIERIIAALADAFQKELYNELLIYSYTISKDNYIYGHITNNVILSVAFAKSLGLSREDILDVGLCAFGHDLGMVEYIELIKKPTQLTPEENSSIHDHPQKSAEMFKPYFSDRIINGILDMHECVNGQGYPKGKTGAEISFLAKVISICDIFEALTHPRNFRAEFNPYTAIKMVINKKEVMFEKKVVKKFVEFMSIYPVGTLVRVNTGETGMVVGSNPQYPTRSIVRILLNAQKEVKHDGKVIDLLNDPMLYISGPVEAKEEKEILSFLKPRGHIQV